MSSTLQQARAELRKRQGVGARYDAPGAPARELDWARRGTAYFARLLNSLADADLDGPSLQPGKSRRYVIAYVGYQARLLAELVARVRAGQEEALAGAIEPDAEMLDSGMTLPARALRHLFAHTEVHLNVEWRDLSDTGWDATITIADGQRLALRDTPSVRARSLWNCAVDLNAGARRLDLPKDLTVS